MPTAVETPTEKKNSKIGVYAIIFFLLIGLLLGGLNLAGVFKPNKCKKVECKNEGACDKKTGKCACKGKYNGEKCETLPCKNEGIYENGVCKCQGKYIGELCEICPCKNEGVCEDGICKCQEKFSGEYCENKYPDDWIGCYNYGGNASPSGFNWVGVIEDATKFTWSDLKEQIKKIPAKDGKDGWKSEYKYVAFTVPEGASSLNYGLYVIGSATAPPLDSKIPNAGNVERCNVPLKDSVAAGCKSDATAPGQCNIPALKYPGITWVVYKIS